jgi:hypothetical protein
LPARKPRGAIRGKTDVARMTYFGSDWTRTRHGPSGRGMNFYALIGIGGGLSVAFAPRSPWDLVDRLAFPNMVGADVWSLTI